MKRVSTLDVKVDDSLKVKRSVLILTGQGAQASAKGRTKEQASSSCDTSNDVGDFP